MTVASSRSGLGLSEENTVTVLAARVVFTASVQQGNSSSARSTVCLDGLVENAPNLFQKIAQSGAQPSF